MGAIFGGSRSRSESGNRNATQVASAVQPAIDRGNRAGDMISALLGFGGDTEATGRAFRDFDNSTAGNFVLDQGRRAVTGNLATKGLLGSGAILRALTQFGQDSARSRMTPFLEALRGSEAAGMQGSNLLADVGRFQTSEQRSKPGIGGLIGGALSGAAALKTGGLSKAIGSAGKAGMNRRGGF